MSDDFGFLAALVILRQYSLPLPNSCRMVWTMSSAMAVGLGED